VFFHHRAYLALEKKKEVTTTLVVEVSSGQGSLGLLWFPQHLSLWW